MRVFGTGRSLNTYLFSNSYMVITELHSNRHRVTAMCHHMVTMCCVRVYTWSLNHTQNDKQSLPCGHNHMVTMMLHGHHVVSHGHHVVSHSHHVMSHGHHVVPHGLHMATIFLCSQNVYH